MRRVCSVSNSTCCALSREVLSPAVLTSGTRGGRVVVVVVVVVLVLDVVVVDVVMDLVVDTGMVDNEAIEDAMDGDVEAIARVAVGRLVDPVLVDVLAVDADDGTPPDFDDGETVEITVVGGVGATLVMLVILVMLGASVVGRVARDVAVVGRIVVDVTGSTDDAAVEVGSALPPV